MAVHALAQTLAPVSRSRRRPRRSPRNVKTKLTLMRVTRVQLTCPSQPFFDDLLRLLVEAKCPVDANREKLLLSYSKANESQVSDALRIEDTVPNQNRGRWLKRVPLPDVKRRLYPLRLARPSQDRSALLVQSNTKSEARNTKQLQNPKDRNPKLATWSNAGRNKFPRSGSVRRRNLQCHRPVGCNPAHFRRLGLCRARKVTCR